MGRESVSLSIDNSVRQNARARTFCSDYDEGDGNRAKFSIIIIKKRTGAFATGALTDDFKSMGLMTQRLLAVLTGFCPRTVNRVYIYHPYPWGYQCI